MSVAASDRSGIFTASGALRDTRTSAAWLQMMSPNFSSMGFARWFAFLYQLSAGRHVPLRANDRAKGVHRLNFKFSKHALEELERRQIPRTTIDRVLESPEQKLTALEKITCYQSG